MLHKPKPIDNTMFIYPDALLAGFSTDISNTKNSQRQDAKQLP